MSELSSEVSGRSSQLDRVLAELLGHAPELEAAAVVSFDGLPMACALPADMDEDRVAAMSAALLSLGERAAQGLGRGDLSQVYVEGENGTVFLVSADDEAVLVAVASKAAKAGLMLFEVRRAALAVADALRVDEPADEPAPVALSVVADLPQAELPAAPAAELPAAPAVEVPFGAEEPVTEPAQYASLGAPRYDNSAPAAESAWDAPSAPPAQAPDVLESGWDRAPVLPEAAPAELAWKPEQAGSLAPTEHQSW